MMFTYDIRFNGPWGKSHKPNIQTIEPPSIVFLRGVKICFEVYCSCIHRSSEFTIYGSFLKE